MPCVFFTPKTLYISWMSYFDINVINCKWLSGSSLKISGEKFAEQITGSTVGNPVITPKTSGTFRSQTRY